MTQWEASCKLSSTPQHNTGSVAKPRWVTWLRRAFLITLGVAIGFYASQRFGTRCYVVFDKAYSPPKMQTL